MILLNGLPGSGKSALARRFVADHPLALCLDLDVVRGMLGGWLDQPSTAEHLARWITLAMARVALSEGHDVIVPQFLASIEFVDALDSLAFDVGARLVEAVLLQAPEQITERLAQRAAAPPTPTHHQRHILIERAGGLPELHRRLLAHVLARPATIIITPAASEIERTYRTLLTCL